MARFLLLISLFGLEDKVHVDGVVVGVAVACVDDIGGDDLDIIGHEEAVDRDAEGRLLVVGFVGGTAGGNRVLGIEGRNEGEPCGDRAFGNGLGPSVVFTARNAENFSGSAEQVLVEVAAGNAVVALLVLL